MVRKTFDDWQLRCETPAGAKAEQCALVQYLAAEDRPNLTLVVIVLKTADNRGYLLRVVAPLVAGKLGLADTSLAALADSPSQLRGIAHLRGHETDRLAALRTELNGLGGRVTETDDGLRIEPAAQRVLGTGGFGEMIVRAETCERGKHPGYLWRIVEIDEPTAAAVAEGVPNRGGTGVHDASRDDCGQDLSHQRADDGPAYLTILLVSHLGAPLMLAIFVAWRPSAAALLLGFGIGAVVLSLLLLPLIKGGFVGFQWARRMHGFGADAQAAARTKQAGAA